MPRRQRLWEETPLHRLAYLAIGWLAVLLLLGVMISR